MRYNADCKKFYKTNNLDSPKNKLQERKNSELRDGREYIDFLPVAMNGPYLNPESIKWTVK